MDYQTLDSGLGILQRCLVITEVSSLGIIYSLVCGSVMASVDLAFAGNEIKKTSKEFYELMFKYDLGNLVDDIKKEIS